jgi:hypothetical protein
MTTGKSSKTEPINAATEPEERRDSSTGKAERVEKKSRGRAKIEVFRENIYEFEATYYAYRSQLRVQR